MEQKLTELARFGGMPPLNEDALTEQKQQQQNIIPSNMTEEDISADFFEQKQQPQIPNGAGGSGDNILLRGNGPQPLKGGINYCINN